MTNLIWLLLAGIPLVLITFAIARIRVWGMRRLLARLFSLVWLFYVGAWSLTVNDIRNNLAGCTGDLLATFRDTPLAHTYLDNFSAQMASEGYKTNSYEWMIEKAGAGCVIQLKLYTSALATGKTTFITGDQFYLEPGEKTLYPHSEGARLILQAYGGSYPLAAGQQAPDWTQRANPPLATSPLYTGIKKATAAPKHSPGLYKATQPGETACTPWTDIHLTDVGSQMCVYGTVQSAYSRDGIFYITFGDQRGDFYLLSYGSIYPDAKSNTCVLTRGEVERLGSSPVIVIGNKNLLYNCK
jgi:hypothetical protein